MKKQALALGLTSLFVISGCATNDNDRAFNSNAVNPTEVRNPANYYNADNQNLNTKSDNFGFTRVNKATINGKNINNQVTSLNREQLAKGISNIIIQLPNVHDASVLVTDQEVLVVYDTDSKNREKTANQVKRSAMSAVPRHYHVYVSDNTALAQNIENYASFESDSPGVDFSIKKTIKEMLKSPQGSNVPNGGNDNVQRR